MANGDGEWTLEYTEKCLVICHSIQIGALNHILPSLQHSLLVLGYLQHRIPRIRPDRQPNRQLFPFKWSLTSYKVHQELYKLLWVSRLVIIGGGEGLVCSFHRLSIIGYAMDVRTAIARVEEGCAEVAWFEVDAAETKGLYFLLKRLGDG